jgi:hypothetical protein
MSAGLLCVFVGRVIVVADEVVKPKLSRRLVWEGRDGTRFLGTAAASWDAALETLVGRVELEAFDAVSRTMQDSEEEYEGEEAGCSAVSARRDAILEASGAAVE